jgi:tripartite-type tricarboxylate transporter receptor subunit TctC
MRWNTLLQAAALVIAGLASGGASAQHYPLKPVKVVAAFAPGAPHDFIMRLVAGPFQAAFRQPLLIEHRAGAAGNIGTEEVVLSEADGHTLLAAVDTVVTANPYLYRHLGFQAGSELVPVIYLANTAQTLVCHPSVAVKSVSDLIALASWRHMSYASGGRGTPGHLAGELFLAAAQLRMDHVPHRGPNRATQAVVSGAVPCGFLATPLVLPHIRSGELIGLAVTSAARSPVALELPTMAEAGLPAARAVFGEVLLAPKGTPQTVIAALNNVIGHLLAQPEVRQQMLASNLEFVANTPQQAAERMRTESGQWAGWVARLGLRAD